MSAGDEPLVIRDVEAAELLLQGNIIDLYTVPGCGITPAQLRAAVQFSEQSGKLAALVCEDCTPSEKYLVIRLLDLPLLLSLLYEHISRRS